MNYVELNRAEELPLKVQQKDGRLPHSKSNGEATAASLSSRKLAIRIRRLGSLQEATKARLPKLPWLRRPTRSHPAQWELASSLSSLRRICTACACCAIPCTP